MKIAPRSLNSFATQVPPLPPHITLDQAMNFAKATAKDPSRWKMIKQSMKDMVESYLPHGSQTAGRK